MVYEEFMESLSELLNQHGINNEKANLIQNRINGSDLMDLDRKSVV